MSVRVVTTKAEFESIKAGNPGKLVLVDFFATWCGPCKVISPFFEECAQKYPNVVAVKVDVDQVDDVAQDCGVSAMPTFKGYKDGEQVEELVGASKPKLEEIFAKYN